MILNKNPWILNILYNYWTNKFKGSKKKNSCGYSVNTNMCMIIVLHRLHEDLIILEK